MLLCDLNDKKSKMQNEISGIDIKKQKNKKTKVETNKVGRVWKYRTEHGQNTKQDESGTFTHLRKSGRR